MAFKLSEETVFIRKQEGLRADCLDILSQHLTANPDVIWEAEDGSGPRPRTKRERAKLKLVLDVTFNKQTGKPIFPPPNTRLSDELVYLATKFETGPVRAVRYPYDFDKSGDIDPDRVPSGPAPII
ncbi:hypothetical protein N7475_006075 [Penicillium sp. IBT 31633x]|nr:hypothetical protein N7475_006075 [Penicillium sp. IBT 31633x]